MKTSNSALRSAVVLAIGGSALVTPFAINTSGGSALISGGSAL